MHLLNSEANKDLCILFPLFSKVCQLKLPQREHVVAAPLPLPSPAGCRDGDQTPGSSWGLSQFLLQVLHNAFMNVNNCYFDGMIQIWILWEVIKFDVCTGLKSSLLEGGGGDGAAWTLRQRETGTIKLQQCGLNLRCLMEMGVGSLKMESDKFAIFFLRG